MFQNPTVRLIPMTPDAAISAFNYLRAVEASDTEAAAGFAKADLRMPALLVDVAERIIVPVTALCGLNPDPCNDSFALAAVGQVLVATLRGWAQAGPDAAEGIAHAIIVELDNGKALTVRERAELLDVVRGVMEPDTVFAASGLVRALGPVQTLMTAEVVATHVEALCAALRAAVDGEGYGALLERARAVHRASMTGYLAQRDELATEAGSLAGLFREPTLQEQFDRVCQF
ncbi:hypothetical protein ACWGPD_09745 [Streptomyces hirsutus]|uniref:hypothetical protein n=1 Tax=Streptomyces hirsutus TaxID=35620 RepID=UPI0033270320